MNPAMKRLLPIVALITVVVTVMGPAIDNPFLFYEDWLFVTRNSVVQGGLTWRGLQWALSTFQTGNWYPLTWLSHMLDAQMYGLNPRGHHLTNIVLHLANTLLVFWFLVHTTRSRVNSLWVASLFALHPLHVESVAWVSERKDLLSTLFWLLTMLTYAHYVRSKSLVTYWGVAVLFVCGLMSKPMLVTLPCALLLLDFWPLRRFEQPDGSIRRIVGEKIPLLILSALFSIITIIAQKSADAVAGLDTTPLDARFKNSILAYVAYLRKTIFPNDLAVFYPYPTIDELAWAKVGAELLVLIGISIIAARTLRSRPYLGFGWAWYLGTLVPVIGLIQVGSQAYADRYTYIPLIGIFIAVVWAISDMTVRSTFVRRATAAFGLFLLLFLASTTRKQIALWRDDVSLFSHAITVTRDNYIARNLLGLGYVGQGRSEEARACFERSVALEPNFAEGHNNLGMVLSELGRFEHAKQSFQAAIRLNPQMAKAYLNLAGVFYEEENYEVAATNYREAVRADPSYALAYRNLGITLQAMGRPSEALLSFKQALAIQPNDSISESYIIKLTADTK